MHLIFYCTTPLIFRHTRAYIYTTSIEIYISSYLVFNYYDRGRKMSWKDTQLALLWRLWRSRHEQNFPRIAPLICRSGGTWDHLTTALHHEHLRGNPCLHSSKTSVGRLVCLLDYIPVGWFARSSPCLDPFLRNRTLLRLHL